MLALLLTASVLVSIAIALLQSAAFAAPGETSGDHTLNQNVDYLAPEIAARLDLDFPVLVPSYVPGPFGGEPAVDAGDGYYSLYWMNTGGAPTLLQITGSVGGSLPAGSLNDLNNQLSVNATVQGQEAIQDLTPNYDAVYWVANGVLYKVESQNMPMGSLSLATSLIPFVAPQAQEPDVQAPVEELRPDAGGGILETPTDVPGLPDEATDPGVDGGEEPVATSEATDGPAEVTEAEPDLTVEENAEPTAEPVQPLEPTVEPTAESQEGPTPEPTVERTAEPVQSQEGETLEPTVVSTADPGQLREGLTPEPTDAPAEADSSTDASEGTSTAGSNAGSDGTGGAPLPVFGGDGTGGTRDLVVPESNE